MVFWHTMFWALPILAVNSAVDGPKPGFEKGGGLSDWLTPIPRKKSLADMKTYEIHIAAVQETRWFDSGIRSMSTLLSFFVDKLVDHLVIGFVPFNKYMCTLRIKTNKQKI